MGVIQSSINQAIGAAGHAAGAIKLLKNQKQIGEKLTNDTKVNDVKYNPDKTETERIMSKLREKIIRERETRILNDRQSKIQELRNIKDIEDRERLRKSLLGGDLNG